LTSKVGARTCSSSLFPGVVEGNHAEYTLTLQRWDAAATTCRAPAHSLGGGDFPDLRFDLPTPTGTSVATGGTGCWVDVTATSSHIFGPTGDPHGVPDVFPPGYIPVVAPQDGTASDQVKLQVNLTDISAYYRYVVSVLESETRVFQESSLCGWAAQRDTPSGSACLAPDVTTVESPGKGYLCSFDGLSAVAQTLFCPPSVSGQSDTGPIAEWVINRQTTPGFFGYSQALSPFQVIVEPVALAQMKVLPYTILYQAPGNKSSVSYAITTSFGASFAADSKLADNQSTLVDNKSTETTGFTVDPVKGFGAAFSGVGVPLTDMFKNLSFSDTISNSTTWDNSTKTGVGRSRDVATNTSTTFQTVTTLASKSPSGLVPGATGTYAQAPFWGDRIVLLVHPQIGIWQVGSVRAISLLAAQGGGPAAPALFQPTVADLDACARQAAPFANGLPISTSTHTPRDNSDVLDSEDCARLLLLDPFYNVGQSLPSAPSARVVRTDRHPSGTLYGVDPISKNDLVVTVSDATTYAAVTTNTAVGSFSATVTDVITSGSSESLTFGAYGLGGSDKFESAETHTNATDWTVTLQSSFAATAQSSVAVSGTLDDDHQSLPEEPSVFIYQDAVFGGFMFQDPASPPPTVGRRTRSNRGRKPERWDASPRVTAEAGGIPTVKRALTSRWPSL
jgi:hypothetical protein